MAEYIEREKAIEEIDSWLDSVGSIIVGKGLSSYGELIRCMQDIPASDVVEVVRCKDCKHGRPIDKTKSPEKYYRDYCVVCKCEDVVGEEPMIYQPDHFCRCGKRR